MSISMIEILARVPRLEPRWNGSPQDATENPVALREIDTRGFARATMTVAFSCRTQAPRDLKIGKRFMPAYPETGHECSFREDTRNDAKRNGHALDDARGYSDRVPKAEAPTPGLRC